jgi:hypothetical protein
MINRSLLVLEQAVAMLALGAENQVKDQERALFRVSLRSNYSESIYLRNGAEDEITGLEIDTQTPALYDVWQSLAENIALPDSDEDDENNSELVSWHTEGTNQSLEDKTTPQLANSDIMADVDMTDPSPLATNMHKLLGSTLSCSIKTDTAIHTSSLSPSSSRSPGRRTPISLSEFPDSDNLTLYKIASTATLQALANCLLGPKLDIVNGTTNEVYVPGVP